MRKLLLVFATVLLIPGILVAATLGVYFDSPSKMADSPAPYSFFDVFLFLHNAEYYVTAIEYQLTTPIDPTHALFSVMNVTYPDYKAVTLGDPLSGHAIAYWPPMNGFVPGYNLVATLQCMTLAPCGSLVDFPLVIGPHPGSGELRGTFAPENELFPIIGLTSIVCPELVGTQEESWGAIKSLY